MSFHAIPLTICICSCSYLILTLQMSSGFPPFYEKVKEEEDQSVFSFGAIFGLAAASIFITSYLFIVLGLMSAWYGLRIRRNVQKRTNGPLPWLLTPLTIGLMNRRPMLLFDVLTLGFAGLMGLMIIV